MANRANIVAGVVAAFACAALALAQQSQPPASVIIPQRLLTEEQRQMQSGQRLDMVSERARLLAEDLRSNNLFRETQGDRLVEIGTVVTDVNKTNVPPATEYLRQARLELARLRPNLDGAEREITEIIAKLEKLLRENQQKTEVDQMLADLKVIIRRQEQVRQDTAEWGRQVLQNVGDTEPQQREIQQNQNELTRKIEDFGQKLQKTAKAAREQDSREKLQKAEQVMQDRKPQKTSEEAARQVEEKKPVQAAEKQDRTLEALREMAKALGDEEADALAQKDAAQELQKMLDQQNALDAQMQAAEQFEQQAQQFQAEQAALQAALEAMMQNVNAEALKQALQAMQAAQQALQQGQRPDNAAANALQQALAQMEAAQQQADAQQGDQQQGQPEQGQPQQGQPHQAMQGQPMPGPAVMPMQSRDPMEGPRLFALSDKVRGETAERSVSRQSPLAPRQRESLFENYASDLPMEYRGLLREYYQVLSE